MIHQHILVLAKSNVLAGFFQVFHLCILKLRTCDHQAFGIFHNVCHTQEFQHSPKKNAQQLPWLYLLSKKLYAVFFFADLIQVIHQLAAFFPCEIHCFHTDCIFLLLSPSADTGGDLIFLSSNLHGHRAGFLPFPVIIADLGIVFSKINSYDQITNFVHIFSPLL